MRWIVIALAACAIVACPAEAAPRLGCGPAAAKTVRQSSTIRVFVEKRFYFACWRRSHGKPVDLRADSLRQLLFRGRFISYVSVYSCRASGCEFSVAIVDVQRRAVVVSAEYLLGTVRTLVATRGGAAAFLADDGHARFIRKLDSLGVEEIDRGADVHSLTLHGGRLHWLHRGRPRDDHVAHVRRCGPPGAYRTEALSSKVRVYYTLPYGEYDDEVHHFACLLGRGNPLFLGADQPGDTAYSWFGDFRPVGRRVFFSEFECGGPDGCSPTPYTADLVRRTVSASRSPRGTPLSPSTAARPARQAATSPGPR